MILFTNGMDDMWSGSSSELCFLSAFDGISIYMNQLNTRCCIIKYSAGGSYLEDVSDSILALNFENGAHRSDFPMLV